MHFRGIHEDKWSVVSEMSNQSAKSNHPAVSSRLHIFFFFTRDMVFCLVTGQASCPLKGVNIVSRLCKSTNNNTRTKSCNHKPGNIYNLKREMSSWRIALSKRANTHAKSQSSLCRHGATHVTHNKHFLITPIRKRSWDKATLLAIFNSSTTCR